MPHIQSRVTSALFDGAASSCFMDKELAKYLAISLIRKPVPTEVRVIDGRPLDPIVCETAPVRMTFTQSGHTEMISFNIISSPQFPIVLGLSWLKLHNPKINWHRMSLTFNPDDAAAKNQNIYAIN